MYIYCTYLTIYSGNKLPPFYIGSTSVDNILNGYRGSVTSKKYKNIWKRELKTNPQLFKTKVISNHKTREEALEKENKLQKALKVVKSSMYVNMSYATINGFFGMDNKGIPKSLTTRNKMLGNKNARGNKGKPKSQEHRLKMSLAGKGRPKSETQKKLQSELMSGRKQSEDHIRTKAASAIGKVWWHNSAGQTTKSKLCPGDGWIRGRKS